MTQEAPTLGCVVLHYGSLARTERCLSSIFAQQGVPASLRVCVINNGLSMSDAEALQKSYAEAAIVTPKKNLGFAAGCNYGVRMLSRNGPLDMVLFINNDAAFASTGDLGALASALQNNQALALVGPEVIDGYEDRKLQTALPPIPLTTREALRQRVMGGLTRDSVRVLSGVCWLVRASVYKELGGLDEQFFMYVEDHDFCRRLAIHGHRIQIIRSSNVIHWQDSVRRLFPTTQRFQWSYTNKMRYLVKHHASWGVKVGLIAAMLFAATRAVVRYRRECLVRAELRALGRCMRDVVEVWRRRAVTQ